MQDPAVSRSTVVPATVQTAGVVVENVTGRPLDATAVTVSGVSASVLVPIVGKVMVLASLVTVKLRLTAGAGL